MLLYNVAENIVTSREFERTASHYRGVGAVEVNKIDRDNHLTDGYIHADIYFPYRDSWLEQGYQYLRYRGLTSSEMAVIASLPYVSSVSTRYMTAGISDTLKRIDSRADYYNYTARFVAEATLDSIDYRGEIAVNSGVNRYRLKFSDYDILAGDVNWFANNPNSFTVIATTFVPGQVVGRTVGFSDVARAVATVSLSGDSEHDRLYSNEYIDTLTVGQRYVIVGRAEPLAQLSTTFYLTDTLSLQWCNQVFPIEEKPDNYLNSNEFRSLLELIEITNADLRTFDIVYTDDMSAIMRFADNDMGLTSGRLLSHEDSENRLNTCVVSNQFIIKNNLALGDTITLRLGDKLFDQHAVLGAVASIPERWSETFREEAFEIVGVYADLDSRFRQAQNLRWTYSVNTIFVPLSFLTVSVPDEYEIKPGEFSFIIDDPKNITLFLENSAPIINEKLGYTLLFNDGGWLAIEKQLSQTESLTVVKLLSLVTATLVATTISVYLFIGRKKHEYAIMRALGTSRRKANFTLIIPLCLITIISILLGSIIARYHAGSVVLNSLSTYTELGLDVDTSIPGYIVAVCALGELAATMLIAVIVLHRLSRKQTLLLLQGYVNKLASIRVKETSDFDEPCFDFVATEVHYHESLQPQTQRNIYPAALHVFMYSTRHIRRTLIKSMLSITLTMLLFVAVGEYTTIRETYRSIYEGIEIKAFFTNGLSLRSAIQIRDSGYVSHPYCEYTFNGECDFTPALIIMTSDIEHFYESQVEVEYLGGFDPATLHEIRAQENMVCILESGLMHSLGLRLGDEVWINETGLLDRLTNLYIEGVEGAEHITEQWRKLYEVLDSHSAFYTIVGRAESGMEPSSVYIPVSSGLSPVIGNSLTLNLVEYTLNDHLMADEFRAFTSSILYRTPRGVGTIVPAMIMDTSEADNLYRTISLLDTLYPIAVAAAIVLSGVLPGFIVIQMAREAAIMRVLGTSKKRVRTILVIEQLFLSLIGILVAFILVYTTNGGLIANYAWIIATLCSLQLLACFVSAVSCSVLITRRNTLELLQVKE